MTTRSSIGKAVMALAALSAAGGMAILATLVAAPTPSAFGAVRAGSPAASGPCVAVIVDFRKLAGGAVQTGCAQGDPTTGLKALTAAGFSYVPRQRDGLICQINAKPACAETTTSNYWSYWYRAAGSSQWVYASQGPGSHNPKPGSTEGWVWQDGGRTPPPSTAANVICPQLAASPTPKPTKTPSPKPTGTANSSPGAGKTHLPSTGKPSTGRPSAASKSSARSSTRATATPATGSSTSNSTSSTPSYAASSSPNGGGTGGAFPDPADDGAGGALGGAAGVALGGAVVLGIGAATVVRARRGRSP